MLFGKPVSQLTSRTTSQRTYWKVTLRSAPPLAYILLGEWHERIMIFRWNWLAKIAVCNHKLRYHRTLLKEAVVEPYSLGANVIHLDRLAGAEPSRTASPGPP